MSTQSWTILIVLATFGLYIAIGWWARVRESSGFFVAGRGVPSLANGMATASDWMSAASFLSMAGLISAMGSDGSVYLLGWTGGFVLLALLLAPYLRKFGKYTVPDFVGDRYESRTARVVAVVAAIFISITYISGQMRGVGIVFSRFLEVEINTGVIIGMVIVGFFSIVGGMKGVTWTQVAQYIVLIVAFLIPTVALSAMLTGNPVPQLSLPLSDIGTRLDGLSEELGFGTYTAPFTNLSKLNVLFITISLMVGTAGLPHVIVRFYTVKNMRAARASALWALVFIALLYTSAPALAIFARYNLMNTLDGSTHAEVQSLEWVQNWTKTGLVELQDKNGDGIVQFRADAATNEVTKLDKDIIVLSAPEVAALPPWVIALVAAGGLAAALSTASGLLLVISSSIAHDIYFRLINPNASETRRVLAGRVMVAVGVLVAGYFGIKPPGYVGEVVAFAFGLAAASFFPTILLGIFSTRINRQGAIAGMVTGLGFVLFYIIWVQFLKRPPFFFGIGAQGIGTVGMVLNFAVTIGVSLLFPPPSATVREMIYRIRQPERRDETSPAEEDMPQHLHV